MNHANEKLGRCCALASIWRIRCNPLAILGEGNTSAQAG